MKVLVTEVYGYIGRYVVKTLFEKGAEVTACNVVIGDIDERGDRRNLNLLNFCVPLKWNTNDNNLCVKFGIWGIPR